jgi:L-ascorbate metabolism protein UlaG (beta-lactamase superfamily)
MDLLKLDDYQSWLLRSGDHRLLIDPWLTPKLRFPLGTFERERKLPVSDAGVPTGLLITAPFGDHLDAPTLAPFDRALPVFTNAPAARRLRGLGFTNITTVRAGDTHTFGALTVRFIAPGFPYSHNSLGFLLEENARRAYFETHVIGAKTLAQLPKPLDALISTMESVRLFGIQLSMDAVRAAKAAAALQARVFVPTGIDPGRSTGLLPKLLSVKSDRQAFDAALEESAPGTQCRWLEPGEALTL